MLDRIRCVFSTMIHSISSTKDSMALLGHTVARSCLNCHTNNYLIVEVMNVKLNKMEMTSFYCCKCFNQSY